MSIPKIIHLCWFGKGAFPSLTEQCVNSWKKYLPNYEIKIWNEETFDVNICAYTQKAYEEKRWAFVSDYVRLWALYQYGGIYMDTDLEVIRDFSALLDGHDFVSSYVEGGLVATAFIASNEGHPFVKRLLEYYDSESQRIDCDQTIDFVMNPLIFTKIAIEQYGFQLTASRFFNDEITVYPMDYFMPYKKITFGTSYSHWRYRITKNTHTIHHDMSSWHKSNKLRKFMLASIRMLLPQKVYISMKIRKNMEQIQKKQK